MPYINRILSAEKGKKGLKTSEASEDIINEKTFQNGHMKLHEIPLDLENGCIISKHSILVTQFFIQAGS